MINKNCTKLLSLVLLCSMTTANAETYWSDNSLSYLKNLQDFEVLTNDDINVFTFEHVSGHNWGDVFFFVDRINGKADNNNPKHKETYSEFSPRLSLSYLTGNDLSFGVIKDLFIAGTYEYSSGSSGDFGFGFDNYLYGIGASWNLFDKGFFNTNLYYANNEKIDNDQQLTVSWGYPMEFGKHHIMFDGYIDWSTSADDHEADFHFNPQLKLDVGNYFGNPKKLEVGIEYSFWRNKFGIAGLDDESTVSFLIKAHL